MFNSLTTLTALLSLLGTQLTGVHAERTHYETIGMRGCKTNGECLKRGLSPLPPKRSPWRRDPDSSVMTFGYTGDIQTYSIAPGDYAISVQGAQGGDKSGQGYYLGGKGGITNTTITVQQYIDLRIVVGGQGYNGAGGGGSFVYLDDTSVFPAIAIAGGGGGAGIRSDGDDATITPEGDGTDGGDPFGTGQSGRGGGQASFGDSGMGGTAPSAQITGSGAGGTGFQYNGGDANYNPNAPDYVPATAGTGFSGQFVGGAGDLLPGSMSGGNGGFGGGGGAGYQSGGGGSGWAGGGGGLQGGGGGAGSPAVMPATNPDWRVTIDSTSFATGHAGDGVVVVETLALHNPCRGKRAC